MFVGEKTARGHRYLYLVENEREGGRVRHRIIRALGRKDVLLASGELDRLAAALVRHCDRAVILSDMEVGRIACTRIGGPLLFGRLWERLGVAEVLGELLQGHGFEFAVERAVFASVLHRLFVSGSDRSSKKWMADYQIAGMNGLQLHLVGRGELTVLMITHKFREVVAFGDHVTILRHGRVAGGGPIADLTPDEMARMMIGAEELTAQPPRVGRLGKPRLAIRDLRVGDDAGQPAVRDFSLSVHGGEIVGVAGVSGNGQHELVEALAGSGRPMPERFASAAMSLAPPGPRCAATSFRACRTSR